jgi:hypothetical protein
MFANRGRPRDNRRRLRGGDCVQFGVHLGREPIDGVLQLRNLQAKLRELLRGRGHRAIYRSP